MAKIPRTLTVQATERVTPNLIRVTMNGDALADFPQGFEGGYVKLLLNEGDGDLLRSYSILEFDPAARTLSFDVVAHGDKGPAARWATRVQKDQEVTIVGPGPVKQINHEADWFLLAGDMTAMPAITVNLRNLPADARGYLVLEVIDDADRQLELPVPDNMEVHWLINPHPEQPGSKLAETVAALPWLDGQVSAWVAGEFSSSRAIRQYLKHERQIDKNHLYLSCYWKIGDTDEGMKAAKKADVEAW